MGQKCLSAHVPLGRYAMNKGAKISLRYRFKRYSPPFPPLLPGCGQSPDFGEKTAGSAQLFWRRPCVTGIFQTRQNAFCKYGHCGFENGGFRALNGP